VVSWGRIPFDIAEVLFVDMFRSVLILSVILGSCYAICSSQELPTAEELLNDLACGSCHEGIDIESDILDKAADLSQAGLRYGPDWVFDYIQYPIKMRQYIGASRMPIMHLDQRESLALALYLQTLLPIGAEPPAYPLQA
jgi:hypothetical protein